MMERLQKIIAHAGVASRRHAEQLILSGQVTVNGRRVTELGTKADPNRDHIKVAGKLLHAPEEKIYLLLHKPPLVVSTMSDPEGRRSLAGLLHGISQRVFPAGRLEYQTSGLLLLTNDGDLANRMMKAHRLPQTYWLKVKGRLNEEERRRIENTVGVGLRRLKDAPNPWYEATVTESSSDQLRQLLGRMSHPVEKMKRVKISALELASVPPGRYRHLTREEIAKLERAVTKATNGSRGPLRSTLSPKPDRRGAHRISQRHSG
jgi:23S rRNA pseudouridine2605 synthase